MRHVIKKTEDLSVTDDYSTANDQSAKDDYSTANDLSVTKDYSSAKCKNTDIVSDFCSFDETFSEFYTLNLCDENEI